MADYRSRSHTVYDIKYHFVWITKDRYKILRGKIAERTKDILKQVLRQVNSDSKRQCVSGSRTYTVVMFNGHGTEQDNAAIKGKIFNNVTICVSGIKEIVLGTVYVGKGILLWNSR